MKMSVRWSIGLATVLLMAGGVLQLIRGAAPAAGIPDRAPSAPEETPRKNVPAAAPVHPATVPAEDLTPASAANTAGQKSGDATMQPIGYAGPERWRSTLVPCWGLRGTAPEEYEVSNDRNEYTAGKASVLLSSTRSTNGWGTLYQFADAEPLRGRRIEFTADLRTFGVQNEANLLVRVDDANGRAIALDNMWYSYGADRSAGAFAKRGLSGDNDWTSTSIVMDIPANAHAISYGAALTGPGKVWIDNAHLEIVSADTPITAFVRPPDMLDGMPAFRMSKVPPAPKNLDFEPAEACE